MVSHLRGFLAVALLSAVSVPFGQAQEFGGLLEERGSASVPAAGPTATGAARLPGPCRKGAYGYRLPVAAAVVDWFRPPETQWGAGNRGWEFGTIGGEQVCAVADGTTTFAGQVAGRGVVSIRHRDGLLSSVTGLSTVSVGVGTHIVAGEPIGEAMPGLHLGFRIDGRYIDPATVFSAPVHAILVPIPGG